MSKSDIAKKLNGIKRRDLLSKNDIFEEAKQQGYVVLFGESDDLIEARGAFIGELDLYDGGTFFINKKGLLEHRENVEEEDLEEWLKLKKESIEIFASYGEGKYTWKFDLNILHETFDIMSGDEFFCEGIIFSIDDLCV